MITYMHNYRTILYLTKTAKNLSKLNCTIPASTRCPPGNVHNSALANNDATRPLRNTMDAAEICGRRGSVEGFEKEGGRMRVKRRKDEGEEEEG